MSGCGRIIFAVHLIAHLISASPSRVRPSDVLLMAVNVYLRPLREHGGPERSQWYLSGGEYQEIKVCSFTRVPTNPTSWYYVNQRMYLKRYQPVSAKWLICSFLVFEFLLYQSCWSRHSRKSLLWPRLLAQWKRNPKQFYYLQWLYQLKMIAVPKRHVLGWQILLPVIPCLWNSSKKFHSLGFELGSPIEHLPWSWEWISSVKQSCLISGGFPNLGAYMVHAIRCSVKGIST